MSTPLHPPAMPEWALRYDEVRWSPGAGNVPGVAFGVCDHDCRHDRIQVIARGPDDIRNMLVKCTAKGCTAAGTAVQCRSWRTSAQLQWGEWRTVWVRP